MIRLESARTLIPPSALARRERISAATGVPLAQLPYAAELIDVADGEERWRPAAEKVLRSYGMRLLIPEQHKEAVRGFIDGNDMKGLVDYSVVTSVSAHQPRPLPNTLAGKLTVAPDHPHSRWLAGQLAQKFQHACVQFARELDDHRLAVTANGTVKMPGNYYRKDDRPELTAPSSYILGADTTGKRAALAAELEQLAADAAAAEETAGNHSAQLDRARTRAGAAAKAGEFTTWTLLDHERHHRDAAELTERVRQLRAGDADLRQLEDAHAAAETRWESAVEACGRLKDQLTKLANREQQLADQQHDQQQRPHTLDTDDHAYLDQLCTSQGITLRVDTADDTRRHLELTCA